MTNAGVFSLSAKLQARVAPSIATKDFGKETLAS